MARFFKQISRHFNYFLFERIFSGFKIRLQNISLKNELVLSHSPRNISQNPKRTVLKLKRILLGLGSVIVFLAIVLSHAPNTFGVANAATVIQFPLSTNGAKIVDAKGTTVLLRGVNWFGIETETHTPHGLWIRDYKDMLAQIKQQGYNIIRLPYSVQALSSTNISGIDFSIGNNKDFQGKTPLEVMDLVIAEAQKQGLMILLDSHRLQDYSTSNPNIEELWYSNQYSEAAWIKTWTDLAQRYKSRTNVIGADIKNEPHGQARWGNNLQATDWRLAAERCGKAIQAVNSNWLIVVEGVGNVSEKNQWYWDGGNLEGVKQNPVRLSVAKKVVYSPHEYGPGVYNASWFSDPTFPNNLATRWETGFNYIVTQQIAPVLIGEFGGRMVDTTSKEGIWQRKFVDFISQKGLSFTYWSWNPNSADTGGILLDDWKNIYTAKQQLLSKLLTGL